MNPANAFKYSLYLRIFNALFLCTAFAPDEYWQSIEVSHCLVFGYGHLTWEWAAGLRSYLHPLLFTPVYAALKIFHTDTPYLTAKAPMLLQAVFAALTDQYVFDISALLFDAETAQWALYCQWFSWFNFYCLTRTYSSSIEAFFTAAAMYWLIKSSKSNTKNLRDKATIRWLMWAALAVAFRPASGLFWALLGLHYLTVNKQHSAGKVVMQASLMVALSVPILMAVDRLFYGRWVFVPWEFLKFNVLGGGSQLYGSHPWHWNFSNGFPTLLMSYLPYFLVGIYAAEGSCYLGICTMLYLAAYSIPAHKEFRFLLPALQMAMPYCGKGRAFLLTCLDNNTTKEKPRRSTRLSSGTRDEEKSRLSRRRTAIHALFDITDLAHLIFILYFSVFHQRAQVQVTKAIADLAARKPQTTILFLTPCHATPYYSHVHYNVSMRFMDCSPPGWQPKVEQLNRREFGWLKLPNYCNATTSERGCFESDPQRYIKGVMKLNSANRPTVLVGYSSMLTRLQPLIERYNYQHYETFRNCWIQTDDDNECEMGMWRLGVEKKKRRFFN